MRGGVGEGGFVITINVNGVRHDVQARPTRRCSTFCAMIWNCPGHSSAAEFPSAVPARCWSMGKKSDPVSHPFRRRLVKRLQRLKDCQSVGLSKRVFLERTATTPYTQSHNRHLRANTRCV